MGRINDLEVGTMGFGGSVTLIGCKIGALNRLPASFFVSVALRLLGVPAARRDARCVDRIDQELAVSRSAATPIIPMLDQAGRFTRTGREIRSRGAHHATRRFARSRSAMS